MLADTIYPSIKPIQIPYIIIFTPKLWSIMFNQRSLPPQINGVSGRPRNKTNQNCEAVTGPLQGRLSNTELPNQLQKRAQQPNSGHQLVYKTPQPQNSPSHLHGGSKESSYPLNAPKGTFQGPDTHPDHTTGKSTPLRKKKIRKQKASKKPRGGNLCKCLFGWVEHPCMQKACPESPESINELYRQYQKQAHETEGQLKTNRQNIVFYLMFLYCLRNPVVVADLLGHLNTHKQAPEWKKKHKRNRKFPQLDKEFQNLTNMVIKAIEKLQQLLMIVHQQQSKLIEFMKQANKEFVTNPGHQKSQRIQEWRTFLESHPFFQKFRSQAQLDVQQRMQRNGSGPQQSLNGFIWKGVVDDVVMKLIEEDPRMRQQSADDIFESMSSSDIYPMAQ